MNDDVRAARGQAYLADLKKTILEHGWVVQGVFPLVGDDDIPFAYTIGLTEAGLSELIMSGLGQDEAHTVLNIAGDLHVRDELTPGNTTEDVVTVPLRIIEAPKAELGMAWNLYGHEAHAVQLVWPEEDGSWPMQSTERQELLGPVWWNAS